MRASRLTMLGLTVGCDVQLSATSRDAVTPPRSGAIGSAHRLVVTDG
jgi:hypothetical protein